jgi:predicted transcriptional regulator of viral defense system
MAASMSHAEEILALAGRSGVVSAAEVRDRGIHHEHLRRLCAEGRLVKVARGLYALPDADLTEHHGLVLAARTVPHGVICLLSALRFHDIGTQLPHEVWMAIERRAARPQVHRPRMRLLRFSGEAFSGGIETHTIGGTRVRVYGPAKTVADCFKYRNKIGLDVALEALRDVLRNRRCTVDRLSHYAEVCRVAAVIRPYLEATV